MNEATMKDLVARMKGLFTAQLTSLNGVMDKLPTNLRGEFETLKADLNAQLKNLEPLDQVPAAQEIGWAMNCLSSAINRVSEYAQGLMERLSSMQPKMVALQSFETRVTSKELLGKDEVKAMIDEAKEAGRNEVRAALTPLLAGSRKKLVELAGLPIPADAVLGADTETFEKAFGQAATNMKSLKELNRAKPTIIERCAWMPAADFEKEMKTWSEMLGTQGTTPTTKVDPFKGAGGGGGGGGTVTRTEKRPVMV